MTQIMKSSLGIFLTLGLILTSAPSRAFGNVSDLSVRGEQTLESLKDGAPITTIGWTGKNAVNILGATSRLEEEQKVMQAGGAERQSALSPVQEINPPFASDETVFFATFIQRTGKASSGVRLRLQGNSGETITGFGAADTIVDSLAGRLCLLEHGNSWKFSEKVAAPGTWHEIVLVLKQKDGKSWPRFTFAMSRRGRATLNRSRTCRTSKLRAEPKPPPLPTGGSKTSEWMRSWGPSAPGSSKLPKKSFLS
jgi:hypothetical protein